MGSPGVAPFLVPVGHHNIIHINVFPVGILIEGALWAPQTCIGAQRGRGVQTVPHTKVRGCNKGTWSVYPRHLERAPRCTLPKWAHTLMRLRRCAHTRVHSGHNLARVGEYPTPCPSELQLGKGAPGANRVALDREFAHIGRGGCAPWARCPGWMCTWARVC